MTKCPTCGAENDWYEIPEAGLLRCPNCLATKPMPTKKSKAARPKTKTK